VHLAVAEVSSTQRACAVTIFEKEVGGMRLFALKDFSHLLTFY